MRPTLRSIVISLGAVVVVTSLLATSSAHAGCTWRVEGLIDVAENELAPWSARVARPLAGVEIKVSGTTLNSGGWMSWGTTRTDHRGAFALSRDKNCWRRRIRVQVRLDSPDLQIINGDGGEWITVYQDASKRRHSSVLNIGARTFTETDGGSPLADVRAYRRAVAWVALQTLMGRLEDEDPWLGYQKKLHVKYPTDTLGGASYAAFNTVYIHADRNYDGWSLRTLMHEVMHTWNYQHNSGITNWLAAITWDFNTHGHQENPNIAFHEGFAEYAAHEVLHALWPQAFGAGWSSSSWVGFANLAEVERNDNAVTDSLREMRRFGVDVWSAMRVFRANAAAGWPRDLELGDRDNGLLMFIDRAADILQGFTHAEANLLLARIAP